MTVLAALLTLCVAASVTLTSQLQCLNPIDCPCGSTKTNITICPQTDDENPCEEWLRCKNCEGGQNSCSECEDGYEGPLCSIPKKTNIKSRQKRQNYYYPARRPQRPGNRNPAPGFCPDLESPKLGSIRCVSNNQQRTCTGRCLPGYSFEIYDAEEITVVCTDGDWLPLASFPPCKSEGYCDLIVQGAGSFNCTTGMDGTRCDVFCARRYIGRYFCYPGRPWEPSLPGCVRPKELPENLQSCSCLYGGSCDNSGNCICPAGRTGTFCETVIPQKRTCRDPGFINNGFRRKPDGSQLLIRRTFEEGDSVVYGCTTEDFALQGSSLLTCKTDGSWSSPLPKCIKPVVTPEIMCPDPGQVANADRLNSDGSPSVRVQQYRIGQSVVYSCHSGYALQYRSLITCLANGAWSNRTPFCSRITSPTPVTRTTPSPPTALKFCRDPGDEPNGSRQPRRPPNRRGFPQGSPVEYFCNSGYDLIGERIIYCSISGDWSASRPKCEPQSRTPDEGGGLAYCLNPGSIANGRFVYYPSINNRRRRPSNQDSLEPEYPENSQLEYSCNAGYSLQGSPSLTCLMSGVWSAEAPVCTKDDETVSYCHNPGPISNGQVVYVPTINERRRGPPDLLDDEMEEEMPHGSRLQYSCDRGYTLVGPSTITCEDPGVWSAESPTCVSASPTTTMYCNNPGFVLNGRVTYYPPATGSRNSRPGRFPEDQEEFAEGTRLEYTCEDGYMLQGSETLRCQSTGFWSSERPNCDSDCGRSLVKTTMERILHGVKTVNGEWPWVVALATVDNNVSQIVCGGAVLNSRTVLTAAHCLTRASRFTLYFGKLHLRDKDDDDEVLVRRSTRLIIHPDFSITSVLDSDIGLILFEPRVPFSVRIQPICLPTADSTARNLMTGKRGYVTGWGLTERNLQSDDLLMASLPFLSNEACIESYRKQNITLPITRNMFCAGFENGEQSVCEGDSGSPLVFYDKDRFTVEGVVSFGVQGQCGLPGRYSVFTKVYRFLPWILRNLQ